jgi:hypothetical protein
MKDRTVLDVIREYVPDATEDEAGYILWNETGYPAFWNTNKYSPTPEDCLRLQLAKYVSREFFGEYGYFDGEKEMRLAMSAL